MGIEKIVETALTTFTTTLGGVTIIGGLSLIYFHVIEPRNKSVRNARIERAHRQTYQQALLKYADTNGDGLISGAEERMFGDELLKDIMSGRSHYPDGTQAPTEVVVECIKNYKPQ